MAEKLAVSEIRYSERPMLLAAGVREKNRPLYRLFREGGKVSRILETVRWPQLGAHVMELPAIKDLGRMTIAKFRRKYGPLRKESARTKNLLRLDLYKDVVD